MRILYFENIIIWGYMSEYYYLHWLGVFCIISWLHCLNLRFHKCVQKAIPPPQCPYVGPARMHPSTGGTNALPPGKASVPTHVWKVIPPIVGSATPRVIPAIRRSAVPLIVRDWTHTSVAVFSGLPQNQACLHVCRSIEDDVTGFESYLGFI